MKFFVTILFCILAISLINAKPAKRFAGFGVSGVSSSLGCVVTGKQLFINGLFTRNLSDDEINEMNQYEENLKKFKEDVKAYINSQKSRHSSGSKLSLFSFSSDDESEEKASAATTAAPADGKTAPTKMPEAPTKPSFCSEESTTQYIFDGCKVQGNKVYVGNTFARDLTDTEIAELKKFDEQMTKYQTYLQSNLQEHIEKIFGKKLSTLFMSSKVKSSDDSNTISNSIVDSSTTTTVGTTTSEEEVQMPVAPNFCTVIY
uniref:Pepsin-I3 domain-containing protein n=1 Tax=Parastrongyloides trichosuri TaxID=131310 RepID=A0A0N4Z052_PARTI